MKAQPKGWTPAALLTLIVGALVVVVVVRWRCVSDPSIRFLTAQPPAEWIVYPTRPSLVARQVRESRVRFRTTFDLPSQPRSGRVRLRAFRGYTLWINGARIGGMADLGPSWKRVQEHAVTAALRPGENEIQVEVAHDTAPPALWLVMRTDRLTVKTDGRWQVRTAGTGWEPVRLGAEPMQHPITRAFPSVADGWRDGWHIVGLWLAIASLATAVGWWWVRRPGPGPQRTDQNTVAARPDRRAERALLCLVVVLWVALCANNLYRMPPVVGFDAGPHVDYVRFLLTEHRLPLANDGWEMYQPPLYYVLSACLTAIAESAGWFQADTVLPKLVSMTGGLAQVILVWLVLQIMFPVSSRARCAGLVVAAAMPMNLYMAQYLSNETMCAALVTTSLVLVLRILRDDAGRWTRYATLGGVLGLALLAKYTALLAVAVILAVMTAIAAIRHRGRWRLWQSSIGTTAAMVLLVAGWFGLRNWNHFRNPFIGNWDPASGYPWWQDPGYRTSAYYLRFGRSLTAPFFSGLYSYGDGIYSTVWGDGLCGGVGHERFRPAWHYGLMTVGYTLALFPTAMIALGLIRAVIGWVRRPTSAWSLLLGHGLLVGIAVFFMTLKLPYSSVVKGFFGLTAMACLCTLGALGFDWVARRLGRFGVVLWIPLLVWGINAYASFFVWPLDGQTDRRVAEALLTPGHPERGTLHFRRGPRKDPSHSTPQHVSREDRTGGTPGRNTFTENQQEQSRCRAPRTGFVTGADARRIAGGVWRPACSGRGRVGEGPV